MEAVTILFLVLAPVSEASTAEPITYGDLVTRLTDLQRLASPMVPGEKTFASTSHDRGMSYDPQTHTYRNWSANGDGGGCIRREGDDQVMVDLEGPGVLWRIWSARAGDYGIFEMAVDGKTIGEPIDLYDAKVTTTGEIPLGILQLGEGKHVLKATATGHNKKARNAVGAGSHIFGLDYLRLKK